MYIYSTIYPHDSLNSPWLLPAIWSHRLESRFRASWRSWWWHDSTVLSLRRPGPFKTWGKPWENPWENHGKTSSSNSVENRSPISFSKIKLHVHKPGGHTQPRFRGLTHHQCQRQLVLGGFNPLETCRIQRANANTSSKPIETAIHLHWRSKTILTWSLEKTISGKF